MDLLAHSTGDLARRQDDVAFKRNKFAGESSFFEQQAFGAPDEVARNQRTIELANQVGQGLVPAATLSPEDLQDIHSVLKTIGGTKTNLLGGRTGDEVLGQIVQDKTGFGVTSALAQTQKQLDLEIERTREVQKQAAIEQSITADFLAAQGRVKGGPAPGEVPPAIQQGAVAPLDRIPNLAKRELPDNDGSSVPEDLVRPRDLGRVPNLAKRDVPEGEVLDQFGLPIPPRPFVPQEQHGLFSPAEPGLGVGGRDLLAAPFVPLPQRGLFNAGNPTGDARPSAAALGADAAAIAMPAVGGGGASYAKLGEIANQFSEFSKAMEGLSGLTVEHKFQGDVNVVINGADVMSKLEPNLRELVHTQIGEAINSFVQQKLPQLGRVDVSMNSPKPRTGGEGGTIG